MQVIFLDGQDQPILTIDIDAEDRWEVCGKAWELIWSGVIQAEDFSIREEPIKPIAHPPNGVEDSSFVHVALAKKPVLPVLHPSTGFD